MTAIMPNILNLSKEGLQEELMDLERYHTKIAYLD